MKSVLFVVLLWFALVGDDKCLECHEKQRTYLNTAHHLTSSEANATIRGPPSRPNWHLELQPPCTNTHYILRLRASCSG